MLGVDELGVLLDQLAVIEVPVKRPDPTAGNGVELVHLGPDPVPAPQAVSAAEPGDARSHHHHRRAPPPVARACSRRGRGRIGPRHRRHGRGRCEQEAASRQPRPDHLGRLVDAATRAPGQARGGLGLSEGGSGPARTLGPHSYPQVPGRPAISTTATDPASPAGRPGTRGQSPRARPDPSWWW